MSRLVYGALDIDGMAALEQLCSVGNFTCCFDDSNPTIVDQLATLSPKGVMIAGMID